jgi:hypothetical protein
MREARVGYLAKLTVLPHFKLLKSQLRQDHDAVASAAILHTGNTASGL